MGPHGFRWSIEKLVYIGIYRETQQEKKKTFKRTPLVSVSCILRRLEVLLSERTRHRGVEVTEGERMTTTRPVRTEILRPLNKHDIKNRKLGMVCQQSVKLRVSTPNLLPV